MSRPIFLRPTADYPREPIEVIVDSKNDETIDFKQKYGKPVMDLVLDNLDATNTLKYYLNADTTGKTLAADGVRVFENTLIYRIRIERNAATGDWELEPFVVAPELFNN